VHLSRIGKGWFVGKQPVCPIVLHSATTITIKQTVSERQAAFSQSRHYPANRTLHTRVKPGAVPVAHADVIDELKQYETGCYGGLPGRWEGA